MNDSYSLKISIIMKIRTFSSIFCHFLLTGTNISFFSSLNLSLILFSYSFLSLPIQPQPSSPTTNHPSSTNDVCSSTNIQFNNPRISELHHVQTRNDYFPFRNSCWKRKDVLLTKAIMN